MTSLKCEESWIEAPAVSWYGNERGLPDEARLAHRLWRRTTRWTALV